MVCGELIVSKSATIPGYLLSLSGTAVGLSPFPQGKLDLARESPAAQGVVAMGGLTDLFDQFRR
jgi:hypothetical protein